MRKKRARPAGWVVYKSHLAGPKGPNAVCEQWEWDAMKLAEPGRHALVRQGIATEAEAERVARESPGGTSAGRVLLRRACRRSLDWGGERPRAIKSVSGYRNA